jgi:hypothetical protein
LPDNGKANTIIISLIVLTPKSLIILVERIQKFQGFGKFAAVHTLLHLHALHFASVHGVLEAGKPLPQNLFNKISRENFATCST